MVCSLTQEVNLIRKITLNNILGSNRKNLPLMNRDLSKVHNQTIILPARGRNNVKFGVKSPEPRSLNPLSPSRNLPLLHTRVMSLDKATFKRPYKGFKNKMSLRSYDKVSDGGFSRDKSPQIPSIISIKHKIDKLKTLKKSLR